MPRLTTLLSPFRRFVASESSAGVLLFAAAVIAFAWSNSPWRELYEAIKYLPVTVGAGPLGLREALYWWVNDLLMAVFFLLVGLEIKRELVVGELASRQKAALAVTTALGGMVVPALLYTLLNRGTPGASGWGVPMATDIAFALGVLTLLGRRVPLGLKVLLTALAIVDDLGAVLVIAVFYTAQLDTAALALIGLVWAGTFGLNRVGVRHLGVYAVCGFVLWLLTLQSGIHPTIAGVLLAFTVPLTRNVTPPVPDLQRAMKPGTPETVGGRLAYLEEQLEETQSPLHRLEHGLQPWVAYLILPAFAFLNAGVSLTGSTFDRISFGIALGLLVGKPLGIVGAAWLSVRTRLAALPEGVTWAHMVGLGLLAGIGFTMALFIAGLAFETDTQLTAAKLGVMGSSLLAALLGVVVLMGIGRRVQPPHRVRPPHPVDQVQ